MDSTNTLRMSFCTKTINNKNEVKNTNVEFAVLAVRQYIYNNSLGDFFFIEDVATALTETLFNCINYAYGDNNGVVRITVNIDSDKVRIIVEDEGQGIDDIDKALEPMFTKGNNECSGLGFSVMKAYMDSVEVTYTSPLTPRGTTVIMEKSFKKG